MNSFMEYMQSAANITGANASQIVNQLDPTMKSQWDKIVSDFPRLYAFLDEIYKTTKGSWKITPAQFTSLLNKHIVNAAGSKGIAMTSPIH